MMKYCCFYCHLNGLQTEASFTVHRSEIQGESLSPLILFLKMYLFSMDTVEIYTAELAK